MEKNFLGNLFSPRKTTGRENASLPILYPAPEFIGLENWINTPPITSMRQLIGKVVLIDFWTYSCINCLNALPYVKIWHKKYNKHGLVVLGIHAPEFGFEKKYKNVLKAVRKHRINFPVAQDNGFRLWRAYKNRYWPALYLIDRHGRVRYMHFGEGRYQTTESAIRQLLKKT